jgi:transposase
LAQAKKVLAKELPNPTSWKPTCSRQTERNRLARRAQREDRYNQVKQLKEADLTNREIAQRISLSERTVRKSLKSPAFPETQTPLKRRSVFDPYAHYVLKRWQEGQHDGHQLWQEISQQGYKGSERTVQPFVSQLRNEKRQPLKLPPASPLEGLKARQVVWWFIREEVKLKEDERENLKTLLMASPPLNTLYQLVQSFMQMVHQLEGNRLEEWLVAARTSGFEELASFVRGIEQDKAAVVAGLTLPYSSDEGSKKDIPAWIEKAKQEFLGIEEIEGATHFVCRKIK